MKMLEFWPDYTGALLWTVKGERVSLEDVPLPEDLIERARRWIGQYDDSKLPWETTPDDEWLSDGKRLFVELRRELLTHGLDLETNEPFWTQRDGAEHGRPGDIDER
jgi:hypothetical protein